MKKFKVALLIFSAIFFVLFACKKDEETHSVNQITYNGENFELSKGIIESYGNFQGDEAFNFDVILLSSGFTVYEFNGEPDSVSGTGNAIVMEFYSSDSTNLASGEYRYDVTRVAGTFDYAEAVIDFNTETEEGTELEITGGTIMVSNKGSNYEFSFRLETSEQISLNGYYLGPLTRYDYKSSLKKLKIN